MKKRKKKRNYKKIIRIIIGLILVIGIGLFIATQLFRSKYMNTKLYGSNCRQGEYLYTVLWHSECKQCPNGYYCLGFDKKEKCPGGTTNRGTGNITESTCRYCYDDGKQYDNGKCVSCEIGSYCKNGKVTKCPTGKTTRKTGAKDVSECVCKAGTYLSNGKCVDCPKCGNVKCFTSPVGSKSINDCKATVPAGRYITCNSSGCSLGWCVGNEISTKQTVNYKANLKTKCTDCGEKTSSDGNTKCSNYSCAKGQYKEKGLCKDCPKCNGKIKCFTSSGKSSSTSDCNGTVPAGKYISCTSGGCTVKTCEGNTYSKSKKVSFKSILKTTCTKCPKGKIANKDHTDCE